MKIKQVSIVVAIIAILTFVGCDKSTDLVPGEVFLTSPEDNDDCLISSSIESTSTVVFSWEATSNAESYCLSIINMNIQDTVSFNTSKKSYSATLSVNVPYSWNVTAVNSSGETNSEFWDFYLSGTASNNYVPYPANLTSPTLGEIISANGTSTVQVPFYWLGSDPDNNIISYNLYIDNTDASTLVIASQTEMSALQTLERGKTYYWKVVTIDEVGNTSSSLVSSFYVE